jgi:hypothetical protein
VSLSFQNVLDSRLPSVLVLCENDVARVKEYLNEAVFNLVQAGGETGWFGSWAKVVFNVAAADPYITLPAKFARAIAFDVCRVPVRIQNEWYEFLEAGIGLQSEVNRKCSVLETYERGNVPTAYDLTSSNQYIRIYVTDIRDVGKRVVFSQALDQNGNGIYTTDGTQTVDGFYLDLLSPMVTTSFIVTAFKAVQKPNTFGDIIVKQVDATTGEESLLARYTPDENNPSYRRYYIQALPRECCCSGETTVPVTAMLKYEYYPVNRVTDLVLIQNISALIAECESIRYGAMDTVQAQQLSAAKHQRAIMLLNQQLTHEYGKSMPAINVAPWGTAKLERQGIGTMV